MYWKLYIIHYIIYKILCIKHHMSNIIYYNIIYYIILYYTLHIIYCKLHNIIYCPFNFTGTFPRCHQIEPFQVGRFTVVVVSSRHELFLRASALWDPPIRCLWNDADHARCQTKNQEGAQVQARGYKCMDDSMKESTKVKATLGCVRKMWKPYLLAF